jgi:hypothetical protein
LLQERGLRPDLFNQLADQTRARSGRAHALDHFGERFEEVRLLVPYDEGARLAELYSLGAPIEEREDTPEGVLLHARLPRRDLVRFAPFMIAEAERKRELG